MSEVKLNKEQLLVIDKLDINIEGEINSLELLFERSMNDISLEDLLIILKVSNALYRSSTRIIDDDDYDSYIAELKNRDPDHSYLSTIEPEILVESKTVALPEKMLSTDKAYSFEAIRKWTDRFLKAAEEIGVMESEIQIRVTPKLDGYAAYDDGISLYTRGDGIRGQDITRAFNKGLQVANSGSRGLGPGEIVIKKSYFDSILSKKFENSRNIQAAIIAEKKVDESIQKAIDEGACVFFPFSLIENWTGHYKEILTDFDKIVDKIWTSVDYDIDGVILEVTNETLKEHMGATRHHHRWQIAFKVNAESAEVKVLEVTPQTSRTGRVTPVAELEPTKLSGATISRATVHHYNMVKTNGVGPGAIVQLVRSGLVIPKIEKVLKSVAPQLAESCPSCGTHLIWESDHLVCPNKTDCPAQTENTLVHFFKTLGNIDGFGPKVIEKLHESGIKKIHEIYELQQFQFISFGFGDKTAQNLVEQLKISREVEIEDWRFLAAFGVSRMGGGNCEKLLHHHTLDSLFEATIEDLVKLDGFALVSAEAVVEGLANIEEEFRKVRALGFNLAITPKASEQSEGETPIFGKIVVFTGSMTQGSRGDMEKDAKALGAKVAKSVTGKTSLLVTGDKVGANKINAARDKGVQVLSELEYLDLISKK
ncbi:helix-hairpin-helix domain-containing protein [Psychromonas sp. SA13A]|uniref:helix-hairpin-helix domain-containing protein n=1 Tax=Psychromonas sp. SA13A TaxID=2686346 RepID=UPI00140978BB|nr:helix-hairpin-helix domain-containing protein [Psychromonas sp. SA13A]